MKAGSRNSDFIFIDFVGKMNLFGLVSLILVVGSLILIFTRGLNYGIDFAGGTELQVRLERAIETKEMRAFLDQHGIKDAGVQRLETPQGSEYLIRMESVKAATEKEANTVLKQRVTLLTDKMKSQFGNIEVRRLDTVGPAVGSQLKQNGVLAVFYSLLLILIYVGLRFEPRFAPGAVICLFHDAIVTLGIFSILQLEVNIQILAAVLTIIGYSLNDTIVVFDRIRENLRRFSGKDMGEIINVSSNETLARTILTSVTTFLATLALFLFAGGVIADFALAMGIGIILGSYSTIYIASPFIILLERWRGKQASRAVASASR